MTARILPFPDFFRPATPRDEMGEIVVLPVVRFKLIGIDLGVEECPKVQELRRRARQWLDRDKPKFSGGTCSGGEG